ncbi:hypothetical protein PENANT_c016G02846 [Penicillium antarcticum]|uniref:AD domain-containing protein n=1 Tax=Penicillium antarcticum TaxID=416450 RepID=A0A1V6Q2K8_9EURO|nr:uncharacterized protein N7508_001261 [Penicillium antarcticum]KAJ5316753.1 hypothetical protein N7508_001261 [Penicillium antarcticum]OQD83493.1 hypothetical protein PENANT_c016G02846 [Penicillium antarcticum]
MAENKRQSSVKASAQKSSGNVSGSGMAAMVPLEAALSGAIGARVRLTTAQPNAMTHEGTLFTVDPITSLVAINTAPAANPGDAKQAQNGDYHVVPISRIQGFQILSLAAPSNSTSSSFADAQPTIQALDTRALKAREMKAIGELLEREARRGKGVTREAQELFDAFSRTMPARWNGNNIIVADAVTISAPYKAEDCRPIIDGDTAALARVRKVLEMERKKIELRNASATIGSTSTFSRPHDIPGDQRKGG